MVSFAVALVVTVVVATMTTMIRHVFHDFRFFRSLLLSCASRVFDVALDDADADYDDVLDRLVIYDWMEFVASMDATDATCSLGCEILHGVDVDADDDYRDVGGDDCSMTMMSYAAQKLNDSR